MSGSVLVWSERVLLWAVGLACVPALHAAPQDDGEAGREERRSPIVRVFEKCRGAVVNISTARTQRALVPSGSIFDDMFGLGRTVEREVSGFGSGVIIHPTGYVVTNAHVVARADAVRVTLADQRTIPARLVSVDPVHDLAVLKVDSGESLPSIRLGRAGDVLIGETVVAIGNPLGLQHTVTTGIVSAVDREIEVGSEMEYSGLIQTDAAINPGNSGGPLLNIHGELMGINSAIRGDAQNVGFAIPVARLWELLPAMLDIERNQRVMFGLRVDGAMTRVVGVRPASPAAEAGLRVGDRLVRFNGRPLRDGIDYYVQLLGQRPGQGIDLTYERDGETRRASLALREIPPPDGAALAGRLFGVSLAEFDAATRRKYDIPSHIGLIVDRVDPRSPAAVAGLEPNDVVLFLDGQTVPTLLDLGLVLESTGSGDRHEFIVLRVRGDRARRYLIPVRARA